MFAHQSTIVRQLARLTNVIAIMLSAMTIPTFAESKIDAKTLEDRHQQVVKMSPVERDHLQRNIATFQQMTPEDQARYRQLNQELELDQKNGGHLSSLMQTYNAWLQTLTPAQREMLRNEKESTRKLALVQQFKEEQQRQVEALAIELPEVEPPRQSRFGPRPLTTEELQKIMKILLVDLPTEEQERLNKMPRPEQYRNILERSVYHADNPKNWPSPKLQEEILAALPFERRQVIKKDPRNQRDMLVAFLFFSLVHQASEEVRWPKEQDLHQIEEQLDENLRLKVAKLKPEDRRMELTRRYFDQHPDKIYTNLPEIRGALNRLLNRTGVSVPRPGGDFPPRFPGDRGPDRLDRGPDRGPDNRGSADTRGGDPRNGNGAERPKPRGKDGKPNE